MEGFKGRKFFAREAIFCSFLPRPASWRDGALFFLEIFDKVSSSVVVNILTVLKSPFYAIFNLTYLFYFGIKKIVRWE